MRLKGYLLAAEDVEWLEASVRSYYAHLETLIVSYDGGGRGWTGQPIHHQPCLDMLRRLDTESKMVFAPGDYFDAALTPMQNDTRQRATAVAQVGGDCDWVLQLDTDEIIPDMDAVIRVLEAAPAGVGAVEWPMRVFFGQTGTGRALEICGRDGRDHYEYPGAIALRPGVELVDGRRTGSVFIRPVVEGDSDSLQLTRPPDDTEIRSAGVRPEQALLHMSWSGSSMRIRRKIANWGHSSGWRSWAYYYIRWRPVPLVWRWMRNFHPFAPPLWPALRRYTAGPGPRP